MIRISTRCLKCTHSYGSFNRNIAISWWRLVSSDGRSERSPPESPSCILGSTWEPARLIICPRPTFSMRPFSAESTSRKACFRTWVWPTSSSGSFPGSSWCVWYWIVEIWCSNWFISLGLQLMSARGRFRTLTSKNGSLWFRKFLGSWRPTRVLRILGLPGIVLYWIPTRIPLLCLMSRGIWN